MVDANFCLKNDDAEFKAFNFEMLPALESSGLDSLKLFCLFSWFHDVFLFFIFSQLAV